MKMELFLTLNLYDKTEDNYFTDILVKRTKNRVFLLKEDFRIMPIELAYVKTKLK
jgi:hypothetical protein